MERLGDQVALSEAPELITIPNPPAYMHDIYAPQPGATIPLEPYLIQFSGHSFGGIVNFEVWVNDSLIETVPPTGFGSGGPSFGHLFYGEFIWIPVEIGGHTIAEGAAARLPQ